MPGFESLTAGLRCLSGERRSRVPLLAWMKSVLLTDCSENGEFPELSGPHSGPKLVACVTLIRSQEQRDSRTILGREVAFSALRKEDFCL